MPGNQAGSGEAWTAERARKPQRGNDLVKGYIALAVLDDEGSLLEAGMGCDKRDGPQSHMMRDAFFAVTTENAKKWRNGVIESLIVQHVYGFIHSTTLHLTLTLG